MRVLCPSQTDFIVAAFKGEGKRRRKHRNTKSTTPDDLVFDKQQEQMRSSKNEDEISGQKKENFKSSSCLSDDFSNPFLAANSN